MRLRCIDRPSVSGGRGETVWLLINSTGVYCISVVWGNVSPHNGRPSGTRRWAERCTLCSSCLWKALGPPLLTSSGERHKCGHGYWPGRTTAADVHPELHTQRMATEFNAKSLGLFKRSFILKLRYKMICVATIMQLCFVALWGLKASQPSNWASKQKPHFVLSLAFINISLLQAFELETDAERLSQATSQKNPFNAKHPTKAKIIFDNNK